MEAELTEFFILFGVAVAYLLILVGYDLIGRRKNHRH